MNLDYFDGLMDCAEGFPPSVDRSQDYCAGYGDEYANNIDKPESK